MQGGFSFCGKDIADLGLEYAPELSNTYVYNPAKKNVSEQMVESHEGGYYFGATTGVKDFVLRCYFEKSNIRSGIMSQINYYFKVGKTGRLVFAKRTWCWYTATVVDIDTSNIFNYENGMIVIRMRAYYPYARSNMSVVSGQDPERNDIINNSGMLTDASRMPQTQFGSASSRISGQNSYILYNPGTERAKVAIEIAGEAPDGVSIANSTTNQLCKFVALSNAITTSANKYLVSDALNGKTVLTNGTPAGTSLAFLYHDNGFLELEPSYPILRGIHASYTVASTDVVVEEEISEDVIGKYVYIDGSWRKIAAQPSAHNLTITSTPSQTGTAETDIVLMNEITVTPETTMSLSKLNFVYYPTFS